MSDVFQCILCVNIDIMHAIAGLTALFCKQSGTRKRTIDPILKHEILIESLLLYYREYGEPVTKDI